MKILVIKLGAKGDVVRTLHILIGLKKKFPDSTIDWLTKKDSEEIVKSSSFVNRVFILPNHPMEKYDIIYNFDIEKDACDVIMKLNSNKKYGFFKEGEYNSCYNISAEYYLNTMFDDELKKYNKKTYQEMMFNLAELPYNKEFHNLELIDTDLIDNFRKENNLISKKVIGIHLGASSRWPSKAWHEEKVKEFIIKSKERGYEIILFGGPNEVERHNKFSEDLSKRGIKIFRNNPNNTDKEFISLVSLCDFMVCSDSFSLHVSLGLKKPTAALFFCTSPDEVEGYDLLEKIISPNLYDYFPERSDEYSEELTKSISVISVLNAIENLSKRIIFVVNAIIKTDNKFLLIKRKDGIHSNRWAFPGGIVENFESKQDALIREIKEEVDLQIIKIIKKVSDYVYLRQDKKLTIGESYYVKTNNGPVKINEESSDFKWVSIEEMDNYDLAPGIEEEALNCID